MVDIRSGEEEKGRTDDGLVGVIPMLLRRRGTAVDVAVAEPQAAGFRISNVLMVVMMVVVDLMDGFSFRDGSFVMENEDPTAVETDRVYFSVAYVI